MQLSHFEKYLKLKKNPLNSVLLSELHPNISFHD